MVVGGFEQLRHSRTKDIVEFKVKTLCSSSRNSIEDSLAIAMRGCEAVDVIVEEENGMYNVSYSASKAGMYFLHIEWYGKPMRGCPIIVKVSDCNITFSLTF